MITDFLNKPMKHCSIRVIALSSLVAISVTGCDTGSGSGTSTESTALPLDYSLNLYCPNVGINDDTCILDDPDNPYAGSNITDITKWTLNDESPSAKSRFYLWGTALAKNHTGENQYYTALALHNLYTQGDSPNAQAQAKKAYRSLLDNFFNSLTFYEGTPQLDLIPDDDPGFRYSDFGSGTAGSGWDGGYTGDADFTPVWYLPSGEDWGASTASLAFDGFPVGTVQNYNNLVFKVKNLPINQVTIKFTDNTQPQGGNDEFAFDLATYATDIAGTNGWKEVTIPLAENFFNVDSYTGLLIHTGWGNGGTFLLTDVAFTGDATGNGLVGDVDDNGAVYFYRSGTQQYSLELKNLVGSNLYDPDNQNFLQLYQDQASAVSDLDTWGYVYDPDTGIVTKK